MEDAVKYLYLQKVKGWVDMDVFLQYYCAYRDWKITWNLL